jgi:probable F420-dependent oxidoreductase
MYSVPAGRRIVGLQLPVQTQTITTSEPWEREAGPADMAAIAALADRAGYDYLGVCDHVSLPQSVASTMSTFWVDPMTTLGFVAAHTTRIMLLTHVYVLPYRNPLLAAKQFATLDYLSAGRAICGIGAGHVQAEFEHLGVDFDSRGRAVADGVVRLAELLEHEFVDGFGARPRPVQSPRPPIWIAGSTGAAIKRAARFADGWLPQSPAAQEMVDLLLATREAAGRTDPIVIGHITAPLYVGEPGWDAGPHTITGSAASIAERLVTGAPGAVNQIQVRFRARSREELCDQLDAFAADGLPLLHTA